MLVVFIIDVNETAMGEKFEPGMSLSRLDAAKSSIETIISWLKRNQPGFLDCTGFILVTTGDNEICIDFIACLVYLSKFAK